MRAIVKDAEAIPEMDLAFEMMCADEAEELNHPVSPEDWSDQKIVDEAEYRLSTYFDFDNSNCDMRLSKDPESRKFARTDIRMLKAFIKKYKTLDGPYSSWLKEVV